MLCYGVISLIYVPNYEDYECIVVRSEEVIRAYEETPRTNSNINYRDFYYNSNYLYNDGVQNFSQYSTLPTCINSSNLTDSYYYRNDFDSILVITFILLIICFYFPFRILSRMFGRWLKF